VSVNESLDPSVVIARLKQEVRDLKEEVALLKGNTPQRGPLTPDELLRLKQQLLAYIDDAQLGQGGGAGSSSVAGVSSSGLNFGGDMMMIRASWQVFRQLVLESRHSRGAHQPLIAASTGGADAAAVSRGQEGASSSSSSQSVSGPGQDSMEQVQALQSQLRKLRLQVGSKVAVRTLQGLLKKVPISS
jgi:kinesin family protein 6/9